MTLRNTGGSVRLGMLALPLAGLLALAGLYGASKLGSGGILATGDNQAMVSTGFFVSVFLGNVLALTVLIFGVMALYAFLANGRSGALVLAAMILSTFGISLMLSRLGVIAYVVPALSRSYLHGNLESIRILDSVFAGPLVMVDTVSSVSYSAGFLLFGIAVWRSGILPRWTGVLIAVHAPLITGPFSVAGAVTGALLALVGGGWIAFSSLQINPGQADSATILRAR